MFLLILFVNYYVWVGFFVHVFAWKLDAGVVVLLLLLRIGLFQESRMTWIMTQTINNWRHKFMIWNLLFRNI